MILALACPAALAGPRGDAAVGQVLFQKRCTGCHTIDRLAGLGDLVRNDMRKINSQMATLGLLWDADVAHLKAYLNSVPAMEPRGK